MDYVISDAIVRVEFVIVRCTLTCREINALKVGLMVHMRDKSSNYSLDFLEKSSINAIKSLIF